MKKTLFLMLCAVLLTGTLFAAGGGQQSSGAAAMEMVIGNGANPQSLDPTQITGVPEHRIYKALFEGLVTNDPRTCKAVPGVA